MYVFAIFGVFVVIGVIMSISHAAKASKQNTAKKESEKAMKILDDKDEFKKFLDYDNSSKLTSVSQPDTTSRPRPQVQVREQIQPTVKVHTPAQEQPVESQQRRQMTEELHQRLDQLKRLQAQRNAAKSGEVVTATPHANAHCDGKHSEYGDKYRVEYVPTMHSIGGKSTEGCEDHYHLRYVKLDEEEDKTLQLTALQKAVVYGEVINSPAFKRGRVNRLR